MPKKTWPVEQVAVAYLLLILAMIITAGIHSHSLWYGLGLLGDYHPVVGMVFVLVSLAGFLPALRNRIFLLLQPATIEKGLPVFRSSHILIFSLVAGLFTFVCPPVNQMMGDGPIYVYEVNTYYSPTEWMFGIKTPFCFIDIGLHHLVFLVMGQELYSYLPSARKAYLVWPLVSALGAFVFFNVLFRLVPLLTKDKAISKTLAALVLTLGTMAIFSGYIEYISPRVALLMLFILVAVHTLKKGTSPWPLMILSLFCVGFYIAFVCLGFAALYVIYSRRNEIAQKPLNWLASALVPMIVFLYLISQTVGLREFLSMFLSGEASLAREAGKDVLYGLFSLKHMLDMKNIMILHSPLNMLAVAWIIFALVFFRSRWSKDKISLLLMFLFIGFWCELFIFNAKRGIFFDWDIFSYPAILLPLITFRLWEVCAPEKSRPKIIRATAILLPLALAHLLLWGTTLHKRDFILKRLMRLEYSQQGEKMWASGLSHYCVQENYFPGYLLEYADNNKEIRQYMIYRLSAISLENKIVDIENLVNLTNRWATKLNDLDLANIGGALNTRNRPDESLYFLRLSTNNEDGTTTVTAAANLAVYYSKQNRPAAALYYLSRLPDDLLSEKNPAFYRTLKSWEKNGGLDDSLKMITTFAAQHVYNNALSLLRKNKLKIAKQELIAAKKLGFDRIRINALIERISNLRKEE
ncbi:hypothetical protein ACFL4P_00250 [Gemmatimonadota bacterium]